MIFVILIKVQLFLTSLHVFPWRIMVNKIILYMYKKKTPQTFGHGEFKTFISRQYVRELEMEITVYSLQYMLAGVPKMATND